jgi:hypothetical protein
VNPRRRRRWKYSHDFVAQTRAATVVVEVGPQLAGRAQVCGQHPHVGRAPLLDVAERVGARGVFLAGEGECAQERRDLGLTASTSCGLRPTLA